MAKRFRVTPYGFSDEVFEAETADKAKYQAFKAIREAGWFRDEREGFWALLVNGVTVTELPA